MNKAVKIFISFVLLLSLFSISVSSAFAQESKLEDGVYKLPFKILSDGKVTDKMDNNVVNPAELTVKEGKNSITITLRGTEVLSAFKVEQSGSLVEPKVLSEDASNKTKVVQFEVADLSQLLNAEVGVNIPAINYNHTYKVQFQFDLSAIETVSISKPETSTDDNQSKPETNTDTNQNNESTGVELKNGEYTVSINTVRTDSDETYPMMSYFENPVTLKVENNKHYVYLNIVKGSSMIPYVEYEKAGTFVKMEEVSSDAKSRIVKFEASNIGTPTKVNVYVSAGNHQATYAFRIVADTKTIAAVKTDQPEKEENSTEQKVKDGVYSLPFAFFVDGKATDKMDNNVVKPAQLTVKDGKYSVVLTLKGTNVLTGFKVEQNGTLVEPTVLQSNDAEKTKTVQFEVADLNQLLNAWVAVSVPAMNYNHAYNVQIQFDPTSMTAVKEDNPAPTPEQGSDVGEEDASAVNASTPEATETPTVETPEFDREENEQVSSESSKQVKTNQVTNAKTFDGTQIGLYMALLIGSLGLLVWRFRSKLVL